MKHGHPCNIFVYVTMLNFVFPPMYFGVVVVIVIQ